MNKNIKRIVALALVIGTVSAVAPATNLNLLTTKAYATDDNTDTTLDSLEIKQLSGSSIKLYSDDDYASSHKVDSSNVTDNEEYYAKTSSGTITIDTDGPSTKYIKVFKGTSNSTKGKSITSNISLSSGINTLVVRVYSSKPKTDIRYDDDNDVESEYTIKIKYSGSSTETNDTTASDYDEIYLKKLTVDSESISLSNSKIAYTYNVANNVDKVTIKAVPEEDYYKVKIDDEEVDEYYSYKETVSLKTGINKIKIEIEDEDEERVYTLNITRADAAVTAPVTTIPIMTNKWVQVNGRWQYNDSNGNPIKNVLFNDRNYGRTYYLQADGNMATGWVSTGGKWYFFGTDGAMKTGWIIDEGKYYYLYSDGTMAANTKIGLYKVGSNGAWIR